MKTEIHFVKLFQKDKELGLMGVAIVTYRKFSIEKKAIRGEKSQIIVDSKFAYALGINLWLVQFNFNWEKDVKR